VIRGKRFTLSLSRISLVVGDCAQHTADSWSTAVSTNNTRPSGVLCRWTDCLEFTSRWAQRWDWEHSALTENTAFQTVLVCSVH